MYALDDTQLRRYAPSVFAAQPHRQVSRRYGFIPTAEVIDAFRERGWHPVHAAQTQVRDGANRDYARHLVRLRRIDDPVQVGDALAELVLVNSHDRSAAYQLDAGLFRLVCSNGMVCPLQEFGTVRVRHGRRIVQEILEASGRLVEGLPLVARHVERFRAVLLDDRTQLAFAGQALAIRYGEDWRQASPVAPGALLEPRRADDARGDLWSVYNRVQENLMRGGLRGQSRSGRRLRTRPIRSVTADVRLNRGLWRTAERFADRLAA